MHNAYLQEKRKLHSQSTEELEILRSTPKEYFSEILFLATQICKAAAAGFVMNDGGELWVKNAQNISSDEILRYKELLARTLSMPEEKSIQWTIEGQYASFAAIPIQIPSGSKLAVLCVFFSEQKELSQAEQNALKFLTDQVMRLVEFSKQKNEFERVKSALEQKYHDLEKFASVVSHDIKSPLANIISLTELLREENKENLSEETQQYLDFLEESSLSLRNYVDGLLRFYRSEKILQAEEEDVELEPFFQEITSLYTVDPAIEITYPSEGVLQKVNKAALSQIFLNLISNALKYNFKDDQQVKIFFKPTEEFYEFGVQDNGNGIPKEKHDQIFDLFTTLEGNDRSGNPGSGIGLATVKKLVESMGGEITVESEEDCGSHFRFKIKR